jgi:TPR repeat protein
MEEFDFPKVRDMVEYKHIDGTPNGMYALRILRAYREACNTKWIIEGEHEKARALYDMMNEHQDQRAKELDKAIEILMKHPKEK